jgi:hypothetical protein
MAKKPFYIQPPNPFSIHFLIFFFLVSRQILARGTDPLQFFLCLNS